MTVERNSCVDFGRTEPVEAVRTADEGDLGVWILEDFFFCSLKSVFKSVLPSELNCESPDVIAQICEIMVKICFTLKTVLLCIAEQK